MKIDPFPGVLTAQMVDRPFTTKLGRSGCQRVKAWVLTEEQRAWLCKWFPEEENKRLMAASGMSHSTLHRFARELGLSKSESGLSRIKKRQARHIKRLCEKNGYYDSLRGRQVSDACKEGIRRRWQQVREGKIPHHYKMMEPRKYRALCQKISDSRRELIRKERMREIYGLKRETKIRLPLNKFTRRQVCHRSNAMKRGYFYMADCSPESGERYNIYYDQDTQRSEKFEQNLLKDGFKILNGENIV